MGWNFRMFLQNVCLWLAHWLQDVSLSRRMPRHLLLLKQTHLTSPSSTHTNTCTALQLLPPCGGNPTEHTDETCRWWIWKSDISKWQIPRAHQRPTESPVGRSVKAVTVSRVPAVRDPGQDPVWFPDTGWGGDRPTAEWAGLHCGLPPAWGNDDSLAPGCATTDVRSSVSV